MEYIFTIRLANTADRVDVAAMRHELWPDGPVDEHLGEFDVLLATGVSGTLPAATFVAQATEGTLIGFLDVGQRSHADGCDTRHPVGYVEGWFVREEWRNRGVGKGLIEAAEAWARSHGCVEMASDSLIDNNTSLAVHEALGYQVVDRCFHYRKAL
jgi:aminoglycoside 6'-N-acetyltransferase I